MENKKKIILWKLVPDDYELDFQEIYNKVMEDLGSDTTLDQTGNHFCDNIYSYLKKLYGIQFDIIGSDLDLNQDLPDEISDDFSDWLYDGAHYNSRMNITKYYEKNKI